MQSVRGCVLAVPLHSRNPCAICALYESIASKVYYKFTFVVCRTKKNQLGVQTQFTGAGRKARPLACRKSDTLQGGPFSACCAGQKNFPPGIPLLDKIERRTAHSAQRASPRTRPKGPRTLSALNFPVGVPTVRTCRPVGTFLAFPASPAGRRGGKAGTIFRPPAYSSLYD